MLSIKEYAQRCGKTEQAVYKQIKSQKNRERLQGHIIREAGKQWLDEEAVKILDESRNQSPVVIVETNKDDQIRSLEEQNESLKSKVIELQDKLISRSEQVQNLLSDLQKERNRLPELQEEIRRNEKLLEEKTQQYEEEKQRADLMQDMFRSRLKHFDMLSIKFEEEKNRKLTLMERITGRKKKSSN